MTRQAMFEALKPFAPHAKFTPAMVSMVDDLADRFGLARVPDATRAIDPLALKLMHHFERCRLTAYLCPAKKPTIGWGMTYYPSGLPVRMGDRITQQEADDGFAHLLAHDFAPGVVKGIADAPASPRQFGAMVALAYNIGVAAFAGSSVAKLHRAGDHAAAAERFALWNKGGGQVLAGLVRRRTAEAALYRGDMAGLKAATHGEVG